jgi:hypothetical protein
MADFILEFLLSGFGNLVAAVIPTSKDKKDDADAPDESAPTSEW